LSKYFGKKGEDLIQTTVLQGYKLIRKFNLIKTDRK